MGAAVRTWSTPAAFLESRPVPCALCGGISFKYALDCGSYGFVRCRECGLVQRNPQPVPEEIAAVYADRHGEDYLAYELANEGPFLNLQKMALSDIGFEADEGRDARILDVGCATGALLESLRSRGWSTAGVELCGPSAEYARRERGLDVRGVRIEEAGFPDRSFDAVHASHLIEHLNDPRSFIRESKRLLKSGGTLLIATPNIGGFQARLFGQGWRSAIFDHLYLFSTRTLRELLESEGFRVERVVTWGGLAAGTAPAPVKRIADRAAKRLGLGDVMMMRAAAPDHSP